jgi:hypothetical protein
LSAGTVGLFLIAKAIWQFVTKTDDPNDVCFEMKTEDCCDNSTKVCFRVSADQEMIGVVLFG